MKNIPLTLEKKAGYTLRKKRKKPSHVTSNRGKWLTEVLAKRLHGYIVYTFYDGDRERASKGNGLFTKSTQQKTEEWFHKHFPNFCANYEKRFDRRLTGHHLVRRFKFLYVRYTPTRKIDGVRSREHRHGVPT